MKWETRDLGQLMTYKRIIVKGTQEVMRSRAGHAESAAGKAGSRGRDLKRKRK